MGVYQDDVIVFCWEIAHLRYLCPQKGAKDGNPKALSLFFYVANEGREKLDLRYEQGNPFTVVGRTQVLGDFAVTVSDIEGCVAPLLCLFLGPLFAAMAAQCCPFASCAFAGR
jgi:hypothetical protein